LKYKKRVDLIFKECSKKLLKRQREKNGIKECRKLFDEWKQYIANNTHTIYEFNGKVRKRG